MHTSLNQRCMCKWLKPSPFVSSTSQTWECSPHSLTPSFLPSFPSSHPLTIRLFTFLPSFCHPLIPLSSSSCVPLLTVLSPSPHPLVPPPHPLVPPPHPLVSLSSSSCPPLLILLSPSPHHLVLILSPHLSSPHLILSLLHDLGVSCNPPKHYCAVSCVSSLHQPVCLLH